MMERRCDRCRAIIPDNVDPGAVQIRGLEFWLNDYRGQTCQGSHFRDGDLCDRCAKDFLDFMASLYKDDRESGGSE